LRDTLEYFEKKGAAPNISEIILQKKFHRSLFICSALAYFHIMNIPVWPFEEVIRDSGCEVLQTTKNLTLFMAFDPQMPLALKKHFMSLEIEVISRVAWSDDPTIMLFQSVTESGKENKSLGRGPAEPAPIDHFFDRVMIYCASQIFHLAVELQISDELMEYSWATMKYILTQRLDLLRHRVLDQLIFCTIYCICKVFKKQVRFQDIVTKYAWLTRFRDLPLAHNRKEDKLFYDVALDGGAKGTIIDFYNRIYISNMNQFLAEIAKMSFQDLTSIRFSNRRRHFGEK